jgi:hypothetical protein|tara:strand:+ start:2784 stop:3077 length:294 start_codon:yes stop_codon:yes gene_type:complete
VIIVRDIIRDINKVDALRQQVIEVNCQDDNCEPSDYTDVEIMDEALYVLSTYSERGHINAEMLWGYDGAESKRIARRELRQLRGFVKKYLTGEPLDK